MKVINEDFSQHKGERSEGGMGNSSKFGKSEKSKKIKAYVAGPLCSENERKFMEKLDKLCKKLKLKTFLPHRDAGLWKEGISVEEIAKKDLKGFKKCDFMIANLNGFSVGAGTAFEMGIAYEKKLPIIAIKTDRPASQSTEEISAIIAGLVKITNSFEELEKEIKNLIKNIKTN